MKTQAENLKVGMSIQVGATTMIIAEITKSELKNGTKTIIAKGLVSDPRKNKYGKTSEDFISEKEFKHLTIVTVK
tara:strand:- start:4714 stop:4938 length:225 start_codon:yes stop_codon:yes gene_type:complete